MTRDRLLLDTMLGKLATYLRMCGYDAAYTLDDDVEADDAILEWSEDENRTLVTRDRSLAERASDSVLLSTRDIEDQLREIAAAGYDLSLADEPRRCSVCNEQLQAVIEDEPTPDYAPDSTEVETWRCPDCGQHFWKGSHWEDVAETLADID